MSEDNKARIRELSEKVLTAGEIDAPGDYFHSDVVEEVPFPGQSPRLGGLKETLTRMRHALLDVHGSVEEHIAEDNKVLTRFLWSGTHQGEFLGISRPTAWSRSGVWSLIGVKSGRARRPACSWLP
jgi:predicted ester cyclase